MYPFRDGDSFATFTSLTKKLVAEIESLDNEYILKSSPTELEQFYVEKVIISPLVLDVDSKYIKMQKATGVDVSHDFMRAVAPGIKAVVPGTRIDIAIPFSGDPQLWRIQASTFSVSGYPNIEIGHDEITFTISFPDDSANPEKLRADIDRITKSLSDAAGYLKNDVDNHNNSAPTQIRNVLERKRQLAHSSVNAIAALGIPVQRKESQPSFAIPAKRRETPAKRPSVAVGKYEPEPVLDEKEYQHILEVCKSMSLVIERNPSSFSALDEEVIRDHFLLQLNGHYEGGATGETFNGQGKTDIIIKVENKNVFIAECKFWHGSKAFDEAVDQLLSYLTWRDSKCALLVFNRTKDSSAVREKMHQVISARSECRKVVIHGSDGDSRYVFVKNSDPGKEIIITTQLYDIPIKG